MFCRYSILGNGTLVIRRVDERDVGVYKCVGIGRTGPRQTYAAELLLACESPVFLVKYHVFMLLERNVIYVYDEHVAHCTAEVSELR